MLSLLPQTATAEGSPSFDSAEIIEGEITVDVLRHHGIAVAVDVRGRDQQPDGVVDRLFILEKVGLVPPELPFSSASGRLLVMKDGMVVAALDQPFVTGLFLEDVDDAEQQVAAVVDEIKELGVVEVGRDDVHVHLGFGFSRRAGAWSYPLDPSWVGDGLAGAEDNCQAGGPGSTSCGVTCSEDDGCEISCGSGYYACCDCSLFSRASCNCVTSAGGSGGGGGGGGTAECSACGYCPVDCMRCSCPVT